MGWILWPTLIWLTWWCGSLWRAEWKRRARARRPANTIDLRRRPRR